MSIGVLLRGFIGDMIDFGDVIVRPLFPHFISDQACYKKSILNWELTRIFKFPNWGRKVAILAQPRG